MSSLTLFLLFVLFLALLYAALSVKVYRMSRAMTQPHYYFCDCCEEKHHRDPAVASQLWEGATVCPPCADKGHEPWPLKPESNLRRFVRVTDGEAQ